MSRIYDWLDRSKKESVTGYENRINQCLPQHAGYILLEGVNYDAVCEKFNAYIIWNEELNEKLQNPFPQGGFEVHCSKQDILSAEQDNIQDNSIIVQEICDRKIVGIPVWIKLYAKSGRLYAKRLYFEAFQKEYPVVFTGCAVDIPKEICFCRFYPSDVDNSNEICGMAVSDELFDHKILDNEKQEPVCCQMNVCENGTGLASSGNRLLLLKNGSGRSGYLLGSSFMGSGVQLRSSSFSGSGVHLRSSSFSGSGFGLLGSYFAGSGFQLRSSSFWGSGFRFQSSYFAGSGLRYQGSYFMGSYTWGSGNRFSGSSYIGSGFQLTGSTFTEKSFRLSDNAVEENLINDPENQNLYNRKILNHDESSMQKEKALKDGTSANNPEQDNLGESPEIELWKNIFGIGFLGYGLDLI